MKKNWESITRKNQTLKKVVYEKACPLVSTWQHVLPTAYPDGNWLFHLESALGHTPIVVQYKKDTCYL